MCWARPRYCRGCVRARSAAGWHEHACRRLLTLAARLNPEGRWFAGFDGTDTKRGGLAKIRNTKAANGEFFRIPYFLSPSVARTVRPSSLMRLSDSALRIASSRFSPRCIM
jgi:hypothetical protein